MQRYYLTLYAHKHFVYAITGLDTTRKRSTKTCHRFNKTQASWEDLPDLNVVKVEVGTTVLSDHLYVFGGVYIHQMNFNCKKIERLDLKSIGSPDSKWEVLDIMFLNSFAVPAVVNTSEDKAYIFGGRSDTFGTKL